MKTPRKSPKPKGGKRDTRPKVPDKDRPLLSGATVARELGLDAARTCKAITDGDIPSVKIGDRRLVPRAVLDKIKNGELAFQQAKPEAA